MNIHPKVKLNFKRFKKKKQGTGWLTLKNGAPFEWKIDSSALTRERDEREQQLMTGRPLETFFPLSEAISYRHLPIGRLPR